MAFSTRYIDEYEDEIRLDLKDGATLWSNGELDRCVQRATDDLSRFYPLEAAYEHTIVQTVTDESWNSAAAAGTYVTLANKPIEPGSESVEDSSGNSCTRDTDYTIDYINGRITHISGGEIDNSETGCTISYKKDRIGIDISAIISNLIRIVHVEYPHDEVPQQKVTFSIYGDFMYVGSQQAGVSQTYLLDKKHIVIYYEKVHTASLAAAAPSYPAFLDEVVCIGAGAYALLVKALQYEHQAVTDLASLRTELGLTTAIHALADTALDSIPTAAALANAIYDAVDITTALSSMTGASSFLNEVDTTDLGQATVGAEGLLETGDGLINTVNLGADVPGQYANYARARVEIAGARISAALGMVQQANARLQGETIRVSQGDGYIAEANAYTSEAQGRIAEIGQHLTEAAQYQAAAESDLALADRFRAEGQARLAEFLRILEDKAQYRRRMSSVPVKQPLSQGGAAPRTDRI